MRVGFHVGEFVGASCNRLGQNDWIPITSPCYLCRQICCQRILWHFVRIPAISDRGWGCTVMTWRHGTGVLNEGFERWVGFSDPNWPMIILIARTNTLRIAWLSAPGTDCNFAAPKSREMPYAPFITSHFCRYHPHYWRPLLIVM